jgi:hypothetical protein
VALLAIYFDAYARCMKFMSMMVVVSITVAHVHVWSAGNALASTIAFVTHLMTHAIRIRGRDEKRSSKQRRGSGSNQHGPHFFLLFFNNIEQRFSKLFVPFQTNTHQSNTAQQAYVCAMIEDCGAANKRSPAAGTAFAPSELTRDKRPG